MTKKAAEQEKSVKQLYREIERAKARIAKERDKLRDLVDDAESILESCTNADDHLECALNSLSEYV